MFKNKALVFIIFIAIVIAGLFCVNLRYYPTEIEAYNSANGEDNIIVKKISSIRYDDVEIFLGLTDDDKYIVTPFIVKNEKFKSKGHFYICDTIDFDSTGNDSYIINSKRYYYNIVKEELYENQDTENIKNQKFSYNGNNYVFRICQREVNDTNFKFRER